MDFCHKLVYCLIVDGGARVIGVPIKDDLKEGEADGKQMYKASQKSDRLTLANGLLRRFVQSPPSDMTKWSES